MARLLFVGIFMFTMAARCQTPIVDDTLTEKVPSDLTWFEVSGCYWGPPPLMDSFAWAIVGLFVIIVIIRIGFFLQRCQDESGGLDQIIQSLAEGDPNTD